ncbi:MAG TPA: hypothetical protein PK402_13035, partial [Tepidisphaeraceae bacterium]|nr:hypothetical protein [Tepidisphaeraceae bacterium]
FRTASRVSAFASTSFSNRSRTSFGSAMTCSAGVRAVNHLPDQRGRVFDVGHKHAPDAARAYPTARTSAPLSATVNGSFVPPKF